MLPAHRRTQKRIREAVKWVTDAAKAAFRRATRDAARAARHGHDTAQQAMHVGAAIASNLVIVFT